MPSGAEITVLDLGYAVEMLAFQVHHAYVLADLETRLPAWLKRRIGQIRVGLDVVIEEVGTDDVTTAASLVKERLEEAWREFCERWHGDDHTRLIRGREETDPECLPENWAKDRSPLNWPAWQALSPPVNQLVSCLPSDLALCFRAGGLLARVEGLGHNEPTQEQIPGEPDPIDACQRVLFQLRDAFEVLSDLDVALTMQAGRTGAEVERARQHCARLDREIRRRFLGEDGEESQEMPRPSTEEDTGAQDEGTVATSVTKEYFTPPELARKWGFGRDKVLAWIHSGKLDAINAATHTGGRPRYRITMEAIRKFEKSRLERPSPPAPRRRKAGESDDYVRVYKED